ncbi:hypothetical protein GUJ93_ZPchr0007g3309 [Zizania palustris]|uniref:Uncharacterized protein n=1 Tax=Zizania palustris TaxID=103762 RepID=A0A8J5T4R4_ZIZPA|nr:hypothetical protein GUJ93_ZPchr0007g3309 [Zizania palustris]
MRQWEGSPSDNPLAYKVGDKDEWSYYKVMVLLSGFAGVYTEDFDAIMNNGFFHGYTFITILMILNHTLRY